MVCGKLVFMGEEEVAQNSVPWKENYDIEQTKGFNISEGDEIISN